MNHLHSTDGRSANRDLLTGASGAHPAAQGLTEDIDPTREDSYWRDHYSQRPYVGRCASYEDYGPAYGFGVDAVTRYPGRAFDDIESEMSHAWTTGGGTSMLGWSDAKHAARDAWNRAMRHGHPNG